MTFRDHYGAISVPSTDDIGNPDIDLDDHYWRVDMQRAVDRGECCPICAQAIQPMKVKALGVDLWTCSHCKAEWFA